MSAVVNKLRRGFYLDSVALMRLSAELQGKPGVLDAVLMIGSESNLGIMSQAGLLTETAQDANANDLVIAVRARDVDAAHEALATAESLLESGLHKGGNGTHVRARSLQGAQRQLANANLALISVPGEFAAREARRALDRDLNVMIFSDNVTLDDELALKRQACERNLLVMGPDCGTAYLAGQPLAFANAINTGSIGVIAASGTGLQEFAVLCHRLGDGLRHGIGVGGRDLSDDIGGLSTMAAIDLLSVHDAVDRIVLIGKPPGPHTAPRVFERLARCTKPVTACVFTRHDFDCPANVNIARTLAEAALICCRQPADRLGHEGDLLARANELSGTVNQQARQSLIGLYTGGTLCVEAQSVLLDAGVDVISNVTLPGAKAGQGPHELLDLGADEYTLGRPHPMIEPTVRRAHLDAALARDDVAVVLLDVVLGYGAHADPAAPIVEALAHAPSKRPVLIASVCGTELDPQNLASQRQALIAAGVELAECNAHAAFIAAHIIGARGKR